MPSAARALMLIATLLVMPGEAVAQTAPSFAPLAGEAGCVTGPPSPDARQGCVRVPAIFTPSDLALAPDETDLYVSFYTGVAQFRRAPDTGGLAFASCVSDSGDGGVIGTEGACADGDALAGANGVTVSPDGRFVYVTAASSGAISWFARDAATGALTPRGCLKDMPRADRCGGVPGLWGANKVVFSSDGRHAYVPAYQEGAISTFTRDPETGALALVGCISDTGSDGRCENGPGPRHPSKLVLAADGTTLYALGDDGALVSFARAADTGLLTPRNCLLSALVPGSVCGTGPGLAGASGIAGAPDGQLIVAAAQDSALSIFGPDMLTPVVCYRHAPPEGEDRVPPEEPEEPEEDNARAADASTCRPVKALRDVSGVAVASDGRSVYTTGGGAYFSAFRRDTGTGALEQFGCLEVSPTYRSCAGVAISGYGGGYAGTDILATSDGRSVYVAGTNGVTVLTASVAIATRAAKVTRAGRIAVRLACPRPRAQDCRGRVRTGRDAGRAYRVAQGRSVTLALRLPATVRRTLRASGRASVTVSARDARGAVRATGRRIAVRR